MDSPNPTTPPSRRSDRRLRPAAADPSYLPPSPSDHLTTPPSRKKPTTSASPLHLPIPLQDLLNLSHSPHHRPKSRPVAEDPLDGSTPRRKGRSRTAAAAANLMACASPRNVRRARRRLEKDIVREDDDGADRPRKRKQSRPKGAARKKLSLDSSAPSIPSPTQLPRDEEMRESVGRGTVKGLWEIFSELIMWKDTARSTLWFGLGSLFFVSSSFSRECGFSVISAASHLGILVLALAFFYDSIPQRQQLMWRGDFQLTEENIVRVARVVLPVANEVLAKSREIFSGEPSMTLKVAPILLFTAKYGHLITPWRLFATGFFLSFTAPKLYSSYSQKIHGRVKAVRNYVSETWKSCQHKKLIAASAATVLWNLFSAKTRIVAAFMSVVVLRYHRQRLVEKESNMEDVEEEEEEGEEQQQQAMVIAE